jgi:hypothetical protein
MATETLRPNAVGDATNFISYPNEADPTWQMVDEESEDGNATHARCTSSTWVKDLYNIADHSIGSGVINFIKVYALCWHSLPSGDADQSSLKILIKAGAGSGAPDTEGEGGEEWTPKLVENRQLFSYQWNTNPATSNAWTWDEIDNLQIGMYLRTPKADGSGQSRCTQVYVEVDYTPAATEKTSSDAGSGVEAFIARLLAAVDTGYGVEAVVEVGGQLKNLFATELGEGSDSLIAKIEMPTKGGGMKLWT